MDQISPCCAHVTLYYKCRFCNSELNVINLTGANSSVKLICPYCSRVSHTKPISLKDIYCETEEKVNYKKSRVSKPEIAVVDPIYKEAEQALSALGFKGQPLKDMLDRAMLEGPKDVEDLIKLSLKKNI